MKSTINDSRRETKLLFEQPKINQPNTMFYMDHAKYYIMFYNKKFPEYSKMIYINVKLKFWNKV